jgi:hypothetical protein
MIETRLFSLRIAKGLATAADTGRDPAITTKRNMSEQTLLQESLSYAKLTGKFHEQGTTHQWELQQLQQVPAKIQWSAKQVRPV